MTAPPARNDIGGSGNPSRATAKTAFTALFDYVVERLGGTGATASSGEQDTACTAIGAVRKTGDTMTGGLVVPSLNGGQLAGMRNKLINGSFGINQRVYVSGAATTVGQYTFDRWKVTGTGGVTFSTTANKTTVTVPSGQTLQQVIEGLNLQSGNYVLSWEGTAQGRIAGGSYGASGAVTAAITGGTNTTIEFNTGTVANVQLELGSVATPFEQRARSSEVALCGWYSRPWEAGYSDSVVTSSTRYGFTQYPEMRTAPTVVNQVAIGTQANVSSVAFSDITARGLRMDITPTGSAVVLCRRSIYLSAEL